MINFGDYVYYVSKEVGVSIERIVTRADGEMCFEHQPNIVCDVDGKLDYNDVLPCVFPSTLSTYNMLVSMYGSKAVPRPLLKLEGLELLKHFCNTQKNVRCYHTGMKKIVTVCQVVDMMQCGFRPYCVDVDGDTTYFVDALEPVDDDDLFISLNYTTYNNETPLSM